MKILYLTYSQVGDRSFGGAIRANAIRDALLAVTNVDTVVVDGGVPYSLDALWSENRVRLATISHYGLSLQGMAQRHSLRGWVHAIIAAGAYDIIVAQRLDLATLVPVAARSRMIFDPDDFVKTTVIGAPARVRTKLALRNWLSRRIAEQSAHVWYSNPNVEYLLPVGRRSFLPNTVVFPNFKRSKPATIQNRLLMVGLFTHYPNEEGLTWFYKNVFPDLAHHIAGLELHAIGRVDQSLRNKLSNVIFHGFVDDITAEYDKSSLIIAPILSGGGTQIKVIDALAHGRPLVASAFAHRGFEADLRRDDHLLVADTAEEWVQQCRRALTNQADAIGMAIRGKHAVQENYGLKPIFDTVANTLNSINISSG